MSFQSHNISLLKKLKAEMRSSEQIAIQKAKELSQYKEWDGIKDEFEKGRFSEPLYKRAKERFGDKADGLRKELSEANSRTNFIKSKISRIIAQDPSLSCLLFFDDFEEQGKGDLLVKGKNIHVKDNRTQYSDVILINSKNEILFTVRNKNDNFEPGKYCLPGGHIEEGEEPISAAVRELEEETGISLKESQIQPCGQYFDKKSHINYFCAHYDGDPVVLDEREQQQFEWVSIDDVNDKPLLMNLKENFKNIIEIPKSILNPLADNAKKYYFSGDEITSEELLERLRVLENLYKGFLEGKVFLQDYENEKNFLDIEKGLGSEEFLFIDSQGNSHWNISINDLEKSHKYIKKEKRASYVRYYYNTPKKSELVKVYAELENTHDAYKGGEIKISNKGNRFRNAFDALLEHQTGYVKDAFSLRIPVIVSDSSGNLVLAKNKDGSYALNKTGIDMGWGKQKPLNSSTAPNQNSVLGGLGLKHEIYKHYIYYNHFHSLDGIYEGLNNVIDSMNRFKHDKGRVKYELSKNPKTGKYNLKIQEDDDIIVLGINSTKDSKGKDMVCGFVITSYEVNSNWRLHENDTNIIARRTLDVENKKQSTN